MGGVGGGGRRWVSGCLVDYGLWMLGLVGGLGGEGSGGGSSGEGGGTDRWWRGSGDSGGIVVRERV